MAAALFAAGLASSAQAEEKSNDKALDAKPYPSAKCLISGESLTSMGKPHVIVADGQQIKFCCSNCVGDYEKDKAGFAKKLAAAEAAAKPYPLEKCVVSDDGFDHGKPYTFAYEGQKVNLCCKDCLKEFNKEPAKFMKKLEAAKSTKN